MSDQYFQAVDASAAPDPVTPADSPSNPSGYASVTPSGVGPAPYSITAPLDDLSGLTMAAEALTGGGEGASTGMGLPDRLGPRQSQALSLLQSPAGYGAQDITAGWSGGGGDGGWPNDPGVASIETPDQGTGDYPAEAGTGTD